MKVRRDFIEAEIIVAMAMGAAHFIEVLAFGLLLGEMRTAMAARGDSHSDECRC